MSMASCTAGPTLLARRPGMVFWPWLEDALRQAKRRRQAWATAGLRWRKHDRAGRSSTRRLSIRLHCRLSGNRRNGTHPSADSRATRHARGPHAISNGGKERTSARRCRPGFKLRHDPRSVERSLKSRKQDAAHGLDPDQNRYTGRLGDTYPWRYPGSAEGRDHCHCDMHRRCRDPSFCGPLKNQARPPLKSSWALPLGSVSV
jgi:hypothetical protein